MSTENKFLDALSNITYTENNAITYKSTTSKLLDFFFHGAALRNEPEARILSLFQEAFKEDPETALRILFYIRDCREGQGERRVFRTILRWLGDNEHIWLSENLCLIPTYGRWDDLFILIHTKCHYPMVDFVTIQLNTDYASVRTSSKWKASLLAKWMPSENASSKKSAKLARIFYKRMGIDSRAYRKILSQMREVLNVVERPMSKREWSSIRYNAVPSRASLIYRKAFMRHDRERYSKYIEEVKQGTNRIQVKTLYPYDIVRKCFHHDENDDILDILWKNLPDYVPEINGLVVADTSGSMSMNGYLPLWISISLAIYISERNKSPLWKDHFITFARHPELKKIPDGTITQRIRSMRRIDGNTNIQAVFDLILNKAKENHITQNDMPEVLLVVSDMEFDSTDRAYSTNFEEIERKYKEIGYTRPHLIFWNVCSRNTHSPVTIRDNRVTLLSGASPNIFKYALGDCLTPLQMVHNVIHSERYSVIKYK